MAIKVLILCLYIGAAFAQTNPSTADVLKALPADLQGAVNETQIQDIQNKTALVLKEKCEKNGGPEAYENFMAAMMSFRTCTDDLVQFHALQEEIEAARPSGKVDEVFKKYCDRRPIFMDCFGNLTDAVKKCLNPKERENIKPLHNMAEQLAEFVCYKDGDRIALFIAEKGPECLNEKSDMINQCVNNTFATPNFNMNDFPENIPEINFGEKECDQLTQVQKCIVSALETCSDPTSGNIIESLFKFARKSLPCDTTEKPNSGNRVAVTALTIAAAIFAKILV
ncbi:27 kDa hemolymph protein-like [Battus philenor]|uniref:27 kDa hemolymph protein-like n=1 Tax=Battus philenor TaxID=42288 RepID=UPI0035D0925A